MKTNNYSIRPDEEIIFALRSLYEKYGYSQFKMVKFEEYDFYMKNKEFLVSENVLTFTDTNGKLMALKPDVTLSIIKNTKDKPNEIRKVYYNENVYRVSKSSHSFREIMQAGLECMGAVDSYCIVESIILAGKSLETISPDCVLSVTDLDILSHAVESVTDNEELKSQIYKFIGEKNIHGIKNLCADAEINSEKAELICKIAKLHGTPDKVIAELEKLLPDCEKIKEFAQMVKSASNSLGGMVEIDFSYAGDTNYYNGIAFKGYIEGIPVSVLSGGQYDRLMEEMGRKAKAVGFAVYLDELEKFSKSEDYDIDTVVLYDGDADLEKLTEAVNQLTENETAVLALRKLPAKLRYRTLTKFNGEEVVPVETDA